MYFYLSFYKNSGENLFFSFFLQFVQGENVSKECVIV